MPPLARLRAFSWLAVFDAARTTWAHFGDRLSERDRKRVAAILKRTKGDPRRLTLKDKTYLRSLGRRLELGRLGRDLVPSVGRVRRKKR